MKIANFMKPENFVGDTDMVLTSCTNAQRPYSPNSRYLWPKIAHFRPFLQCSTHFSDKTLLAAVAWVRKPSLCLPRAIL